MNAGAILFALVLLGALVSFGVNYHDPNDFKWAGISVLGGISVLALPSSPILNGKIAVDKIDIAVLLFIGYALLSLAWSPDPASGLAFIFKFSLCAVIFLAIKNTGKEEQLKYYCIAISVALCVVLSFLALEIGANAGFVNENYLTEFLLLGLPFLVGLAAIYRNLAVRIAVVVLTVAIVGYLIFFNPSKLEFAIIPGAALLALAISPWPRNKKYVPVAWLIILLAMSFFVWNKWIEDSELRDSIYPRIALNVNTFIMWLENPLLGNGAGSFSALYPLYQERHLAWLDVGKGFMSLKQTQAGAAHNEYLQLLTSFGLLGASIVLWFMFRLTKSVRNNKNPMVWIGGAVAVICMINALLEFPLQNPATAILAVIGLGFLAKSADEKHVIEMQIGQIGTITLLLLAGMSAITIGYGAYRFDEAQMHYTNGAKYINADPEYAFKETMKAHRLYPLDTFMRTNLYVLTTRWQEVTNQSPLPPEEVDNIFKIAISAGPNTNLLLARIQYLINSNRYVGRKDEIENWFSHLSRNATRIVDVWLLDSYYKILVGKPSEAQESLQKAVKLGLTENQQQLFANLQNMMSERMK